MSFSVSRFLALPPILTSFPPLPVELGRPCPPDLCAVAPVGAAGAPAGAGPAEQLGAGTARQPDPPGVSARSQPAVGGLHEPRPLRPPAPPAADTAPAAGPGRLLQAQPLLRPADAAAVAATGTHTEPVCHLCLPALRQEVGMGTARCSALGGGSHFIQVFFLSRNGCIYEV